MRALNAIELPPNEMALLANYLRWKVVSICLQADSGHIGASSGAVELLTVLYFGGVLRINPHDDKDPDRDIVVLRGHLGPLRYSIFNLLGWIHDDELSQYRRFGSRLHGHEDHRLTPGVDMGPNGSLGMLLSYGTGAALVRKHDNNSGRVFVFIGDGEEQEGNVSEAARHAATLNLSNLIAVIDKNGKQLSDPTSVTDRADLPTLWRSYGWNVIELDDGHDITKIRVAYLEALCVSQSTLTPTVIIAHTVKGYRLPCAESHFSGYHTMSAVKREVVQKAFDLLTSTFSMDELGQVKLEPSSFRGKSGDLSPSTDFCNSVWAELELEPGNTTPRSPNHCQFDYFRQLGEWIISNGLQNDFYFLTADVTRQDHVNQIGLRDFAHYFNVGIREQHLISLSHGISLTNNKARTVINSVDAFVLRASDQLLAAVQGGSRLIIIGDVAGLTNGKNGKTHQSSVQPMALRNIPGLIYLEPWDSFDMYRCLNFALSQNPGIVYIRVHNASVPNTLPSVSKQGNLQQYVVYEPESTDPEIVILASGCTVSEAITAAQTLDTCGVKVSVVNAVSHRIGTTGLKLLGSGQLPILTVYNGLAETLAYSVSHALISVPGTVMPVIVSKGFTFGTTGDFASLMRHYGLSSDAIIRASTQLLSRT